MLRITAGDLEIDARFEDSDAPNTVRAIRGLLPIRSTLIHGKWSGEAGIIGLAGQTFSMGDTEHESFENHTHFPPRGALIIYPGGFSTVEILFAYGTAVFDDKIGHLAGNHFASVDGQTDKLKELGRRLLWNGAQDVVIEEVG
jgi:hypothetical protein